MAKMGFNGLTGRELKLLEANFQIPKIPGFPIQMAENDHTLTDISATVLFFEFLRFLAFWPFFGRFWPILAQNLKKWDFWPKIGPK